MRILALCWTCVLCSTLAFADVPLTAIQYDATLVGPIAEVTVRQVFTNDSPEPLDARYVFPLHENAAVDSMEMRIGDRTITGAIEEKSEAEARYRDARAAGQTAAITTQQRPNVFEQRVANIPPGAAIEVVISVVQPVPRIDGATSSCSPCRSLHASCRWTLQRRTGWQGPHRPRCPR